MDTKEFNKHIFDYAIYPILEEYAEYNQSMSDELGKPVYIWKLKAFDELNELQIEQIINLAHSSAVRILIEYDVTLDLYKRVKKLEKYIENLDILLHDQGYHINRQM